MDLLSFGVTCLATWRISSLLSDEEGPLEVFSKFRNLVGVKYNEKSEAYDSNEIAKQIMCMWCLSLWIGILVWITILIFPVFVYFLYPFAFSAIAMLADKQLWRGYKRQH